MGGNRQFGPWIRGEITRLLLVVLLLVQLQPGRVLSAFDPPDQNFSTSISDVCSAHDGGTGKSLPSRPGDDDCCRTPGCQAAIPPIPMAAGTGPARLGGGTVLAVPVGHVRTGIIQAVRHRPRAPPMV